MSKTKLRLVTDKNVLTPALAPANGDVRNIAYWLAQMPKRELAKVASFAANVEISEKKTRNFLVALATQSIFWAILPDRKSVVEAVSNLWSKTIPAFAVVIFHKDNDWGSPEDYDCFQVTGRNNWGQSNVAARLVAVRWTDVTEKLMLTCNIEGCGSTIASAGELVKINHRDEKGLMVETADGRAFYVDDKEIALEI